MTGLFPERVETDRLALERLCRENVDVLEYYRHVSHRNPHAEEVTEHLTWDPHETPKETREFVESMERAWDDGEDAVYVVRPKEGEDGAGELAGTAGLHPTWERRTATFGVWLRKPFWGRGYSGERAAALMAVVFDRLDLDVVAVEHQEGNDASERAIEKYVERFGGQYDGLLRNGSVGSDGPVDLHRYTVTREQWAEADASDEVTVRIEDGPR